MTTLLDHLIVISALRDRHLINDALANALCALVGADECAVCGVTTVQGLRYLSCLQHGSRLLTEVPILTACIDQRSRHVVEYLDDKSCITWIPIWNANGNQVDAFVRIVGPAPAAQEVLEQALGVITVYRNFVHLLDDNEHDSLTGLLNRKTFDRQFSELVGSVMVEGDNPLFDADQRERRIAGGSTQHWLAVIDIDHFKKVNDQFGHVYGDEVLILLANILKTSFRDQDRVFRFGGEEFVVLLRATSLEHARKSFERLRAQVEEHDFPQIKRITISLGFVSISHDTPVAILGHADQALYFAKDNGRNQVCFYDELVESGRLRIAAPNLDAEFF